MLQCEECDKWRLIFAKEKLTKQQKEAFQDVLDGMSYTCGLTFGMYDHVDWLKNGCIFGVDKYNHVQVHASNLKMSYSNIRGAFVDDLQLPHGLDVYVKDHDCCDHVEKLYYSCGFHAICIYCGEYLNNVDEEESTYPQCKDCDKVKIQKRSTKLFL